MMKFLKNMNRTKLLKRYLLMTFPKNLFKFQYLPHQPVLGEDKETTKIRAVFDASCALQGQSSNDYLHSAPNLLSKIFDVLLRFRFNFIAILANIKQAFLNVEISKEHRDFLRFLWY